MPWFRVDDTFPGRQAGESGPSLADAPTLDALEVVQGSAGGGPAAGDLGALGGIGVDGLAAQGAFDDDLVEGLALDLLGVELVVAVAPRRPGPVRLDLGVVDGVVVPGEARQPALLPVATRIWPQPGRMLLFAASALMACSTVTGCGARPAGPLPAPAQPSAAAAAAASAALDRMPVVPQPPADPNYRRSSFGRAWADTDHDGCSQRAQALAAGLDRALPYVEGPRGRCRHDVSSGSWVDPYSGVRVTLSDVHDQHQAEELPVDHIVALAVADRYGAASWSAEKKLIFATDLQNLQPTSRASNSAKSDRDPAQWRPAKPYACGYAVKYVEVKAKWALPVDQSEKNALHDMLATCSATPAGVR